MLQPDKSYIVQRRGIRLRRAQRRVTVCRRTGAFLRFFSQKISLYLTSYDNTATVYLISNKVCIYIYIIFYIYIYHLLVKHAFHRFYALTWCLSLLLFLNSCVLYIFALFIRSQSRTKWQENANFSTRSTHLTTHRDLKHRDFVSSSSFFFFFL